MKAPAQVPAKSRSPVFDMWLRRESIVTWALMEPPCLCGLAFLLVQ